MKILIDTNELRNAGMDDTIIDKLLRKSKANGDEFVVSPVSIYELLAHIDEKEDSGSFRECAKALWACYKLCNKRILKGFEHILKDIHAKSNSSLYEEDSKLYCSTILFDGVQTYQDLLTKKKVVHNVVLKNKKFKETITYWLGDDMKSAIAEDEHDFIEDMYDHVIFPIDNDIRVSDSGKGPFILPKNEKLKKAKEYIKNEQYKEDFVLGLFQHRANIAVSQDRVKDLIIKINPLIEYYKSFLSKIFTQKYRFDKNANDIHDFNIAIHLCNGETALMTRDKSFKDKIKFTDTKVLTINDYLN